MHTCANAAFLCSTTQLELFLTSESACPGVKSNNTEYQADVIVLAAALGIPELVKPLGLSVPLTAKPRTVTVITKPLKPLLKHIVVNGKRQTAYASQWVIHRG